MTDLKLRTQLVIASYLVVQRLNPITNISDSRIIKIKFLDEPLFPPLIKLRFQVDESKTPSQGKVNKRKRSISNIHGSDDKKIIWKVNALFLFPWIGKAHRLSGISLTILHEREDFAKDLSRVTAIHFLNYEHEWYPWFLPSRGDSYEKYAVDEV